MKVCVFGASGYVGSSIYEAFKNNDKAQAIGVDLDEVSQENFIQLDVNDPESFSQFYKEVQPDIVVWAMMAGADEHRLSDEGLLHLISHMEPCTKLIYLSSDYVFAKGKGPYAEDDMLQLMADDHGMSGYANAKIKAERFIERELTNFCILRTGPIYGKNASGKLDLHMQRLEEAAESGDSVSARDDLIRTFVHIDDFCKIVVEMAMGNRTGIYHVGPGKHQSFYEFMKEQANLAGYDETVVRKEERKVEMNLPKNTALLTDRLRMITTQNIR